MNLHLYRPQRSWGKVMFLQASVILLTGGRVWLAGGAWLWGGMHGFFEGCMVFLGGHVWFFLGACVVFWWGVHGFFEGACIFFWWGVHRIRRDTVNEQAVRILLECILVKSNVLFLFFGNNMIDIL